MAVVSPGRGSGRRRDSGVALVELPQSPQNIAPSGSVRSADPTLHGLAPLRVTAYPPSEVSEIAATEPLAPGARRGEPALQFVDGAPHTLVVAVDRAVGCEHRPVDDRGEHERREPADGRRLLGARGVGRIG